MRDSRFSYHCFAGALCLLTCVSPVRAAEDAIPSRPEKLTFPTLDYQPPDPAAYRVPLKSGPVAYIVPDRELPVVNIVVLVRTGEYLDPEGKEGLASLTGSMLARGGTRTNTAEQLDERLAFLAAQLNSNVGEWQGSVSLNLLSKDLNEGLEILREVLSAPRFQEDRVALRKQQELQAMRERNDDSSAIEGREAGFIAYGERFWANRYSTAASIQSITHDDLKAFHQKWFTPSNFIIAASGDFDARKMKGQLEQLFSQWPYAGQTPPPIPTNTVFAGPGIYIVDKDVNQGRVSMILPGIMRDDPEYFAGAIMNDILGGGGFTSRVMNRVRSDEGLAYDAHSSFPGGIYYPGTFSVNFQSKSRTVPYAASLVIEEVKRMASEKVTEAELNTSKRGYIERFPRTFGSKAQVAATFAQDEFTGRFARNPNYWKQYRSRIDAVTAADVQKVAQTFLHPDNFAILVVGQKSEIEMGHPDHPGKLDSLTNGKVHNVPLRDPLTMKPMNAATASRQP